MKPPTAALSLRSRIPGLPATAVLAVGTALVAAVVATCAPAFAQRAPADSMFRDFVANGDFILVVDGKEFPKAEILKSDMARSFLILTSELPSPVLINTPASEAQTVDLMKVDRKADGSVDLLADAVFANGVKYSIQDAEISFDVAGRSCRLKQRPWLLGQHSGAELLDHSPAYVQKAKAYAPDAAIVKRLKATKEAVRVLTFFGSWCPHCKEHVPLLLKVEQELAGSKIRFDYYGLPSGFGKEPEAVKYGIGGVPTAILFVGDKEIGRIPNSQWSNPEVALDLQINGPGRSKAR